jgi:hypothetical protein
MDPGLHGNRDDASVGACFTVHSTVSGQRYEKEPVLADRILRITLSISLMLDGVRLG